MAMELRFSETKIEYWADEYANNQTEAQQAQEAKIMGFKPEFKSAATC